MTLDLKTSADELVLGRAMELAEQWQWEACRLRTARDREYEAMMQRLLANPEEKSFLTALVDQAFRSREPRRVVDQFLHLLRKSGVPRFVFMGRPVATQSLPAARFFLSTCVLHPDRAKVAK